MCTLLKSLALPWTIIVYGEFAALLVDRSYGIGTSSPTILHKWFGGGRILYDYRNFVRLMTNNKFAQLHHFRTNATIEENHREIINDSIAYGILTLMATIWQFVFGIFGVDCFNRTAIRQVTRIRIKYFESLMRQDIAWYDVFGHNQNFSVRITE